MARSITAMNRVLAVLGAVLGWSALALQLVLLVRSTQAHGGTAVDGVWRFVGFFTIWSNVLAAAVLSRAALLGVPQPRIELAAASAMVVVDAVYSLVLRQLYHPQGPDKLADHILHDVAPVIFVLFWMTRPRGILRLKDVPYCLVLPGVYCLVALLRGAVEGWYPYPFLDARTLDAGSLAVNCVGLSLLFLALGLLFWTLDKGFGRFAAR